MMFLKRFVAEIWYLLESGQLNAGVKDGYFNVNDRNNDVNLSFRLSVIKHLIESTLR